ncbi:MAG: diguanylate cyclase [Spirochaetes bacterium]|jgi:GGDEF domain-containing protein|nr:diguanylate cyclase [Spirochaetota bacterium]
MGLLEKALSYKNRMNNEGKTSIMDRIKGPAETSFADDEFQSNGDEPGMENGIVYLKKTDLVEVETDNAGGVMSKNPASDDLAIDEFLSDVDETPPSSTSGNAQKMSREPSAEKTFPGRPEKKDINQPQGGDSAVTRPGRITGITSQGEDTSDYMTLYEIGRDLVRAETKEQLFDIIMFSLMGQLGVTSSSILIPVSNDGEKWKIVESRGVTIDDENLMFDKKDGILGELVKCSDIIDIEDYKNSEGFRDDYLNYISVDARLLVPMIHEENVIGAIVAGNKLVSDEVTGDEINFIRSIADFSAHIYGSIISREEVYRNLEELRMNESFLGEINGIKKSILMQDDVDGLTGILQDEFKKIGLDSYALFLKDAGGDFFDSVVCEKEDFLGFKESPLSIDSSSGLVTRIINSENPLKIDDFRSSDIVNETLTANRISKMNTALIYSYKISRSLKGFIIVFRISELADMNEIDKKITALSETVFASMETLMEIRAKSGRFFDSMDLVLKKIEKEINNARNLGIPLVLAVISIKNLKRYNLLFGYNRTNDLMDDIESIIKARLSDVDFCIRYDRHKFLIVLPGKDRKYAIPFASAIHSEITGKYSSDEIQLLVTNLVSEFPADGDDPYALIDALD